MKFLVVILIAFFVRDANAYLDPGTGSIVMQAIAGGAAGLLFLVKVYWKKIRAIWNKNQPPNP